MSLPDDEGKNLDPLDPEEELYRSTSVVAAQEPATQEPAALEPAALEPAALEPAAFGLPKMFAQLDIPSLPPLPPMPSPDTSVFPKAKAGEESEHIPNIVRCPIKSYTYFQVRRDAFTPQSAIDFVTQILDTQGVRYKRSSEGLKLKGAIGDSSDQYESTGSFSFVFQMFYSKDETALMGVFRRLCGDMIAYNDKYRSFMENLMQTEMARHLIRQNFN